MKGRPKKFSYEKKQVLSVRITKKYLQELKKIEKSQGISKSETLNRIFCSYFETKKGFWDREVERIETELISARIRRKLYEV